MLFVIFVTSEQVFERGANEMYACRQSLYVCSLDTPFIIV